MPSGQIEARGSAEQTANFAALIGLMAQQTEVWVTRADPNGNAEAVDILSADLDFWNDPASVAAFWNNLRANLAENTVEGFQPLHLNATGEGPPDLAGIRIIKAPDAESRGKMRWSDEEHAQIREAANAASAWFGLRDGVYDHTHVQLDTVGNDWEEHPDGQVYRQRLDSPGRHSVQARDIDHLLAQSRGWIDQAFESHAKTELGKHRAKRGAETDLSEIGQYPDRFLNRLVDEPPCLLAKASDARRRWPRPPPAFQHLYLDELHALHEALDALVTLSPTRHPEPVEG